ncbi:hypothetical protein EV702DRAFT_1182411 [Suillus placidus]|uniref:CxC1-like cysteine cluster associated with KDZ transposases domain-containing protein n=1 Tax=Suillus placidus TaxID=48579 RepID=A0A9P6ZGZ1_9AGAM|nr:hypothetical protein EV702DRAFT_1182411 [Suillus placidus]
MDFDAVLPPPGEEAHALSHAGEEMLLYQELDQLTNDHRNIHTEAKKLCHLHNVYYHRYLATQYCIAYDVYLEVLRRIDMKIDTHLGHDTPHWRMLNSCPACQYTLEDEPALKFSVLCACDGNNSAKLVDPVIRRGNECLDPRSGLSSIWLTEEYVDGFKDKVQSARTHPDDPWVDEPDSTDAEPSNCLCWRNAAPESHKKMFAIFKKSGIFITICRHGFLLTICDMYPIASLKKLMDVFGPNILYGYDIKCAFKKILLRSSLADDVKRLNIQGVVPAFHRHAHNRLCQVQHHSKYMVGAGKEDFETCERMFSESNALAAQTRNATEFHCHQALDEHFRFADMDKLLNFIHQNYVQALLIINASTIFLSNFQTSTPDIDFAADLEDEHACLQALAHKKDETSVEVDYVKALVDLEDVQLNLRLDVSPKDAGHVRRRHTNTTNKLDQKLEIVEDYERQMALETCWHPEHPERLKAQSQIMHQLYHKAVSDVERLVVMRLLELTKMQMNGLGYKLRTQISTALKMRATAIRSAIQRYNKYAALLNPPRAPLQWEQIVEYSFLAEFDLLRDSDSNIQAKRWVSPSYRNASAQYFELQRAKEEVQHLNVEIGRLLTKIRDDTLKYPTAIKKLEETDPFLAGELTRHWQYLKSVNARHLWRFQKTCSLPGYSSPPDDSAIPHASEEESQSVVESEEECGDTDELEQVWDYIDSLDHHIMDTSINE